MSMCSLFCAIYGFVHLERFDLSVAVFVFDYFVFWFFYFFLYDKKGPTFVGFLRAPDVSQHVCVFLVCFFYVPILSFLCFRPFSVPVVFVCQILMFPLFLLHVLLLFALPSLTFLYTGCTCAMFLAENSKQSKNDNSHKEHQS